MASDGPADRMAEDVAEDMVLVDAKMVRGSTHNKDRVTLTTLVPKGNISEALGDIRGSMEEDMLERRKFLPED